jgi:hypothetical protein
MDDGTLAYANKAEAATTSKPMLAKLKLEHVLVRLPFSNFVPTKLRNGKREIARSVYGCAH